MYRNLQNNNLGQLAVNLPPASALWEVASGQMDSGFAEVVYLIYDEINREEKWYNWFPFFESWTFGTVESILNTYMNLAESGSIPEWGNGEADRIIASVATSSGRNRDIVDKVLSKLYQCTTSGRISTYEYLAPKTWQEHSEERESKAPATQGIISQALDTVKSGAETLMWLVGIAAVGVIAYKVYEFSKE